MLFEFNRSLIILIRVSVFLSMSLCLFFRFFVFKQKTAYGLRISDWSSDVCSSDLACMTLVTLGAGAAGIVELKFGLTPEYLLPILYVGAVPIALGDRKSVV